MKEAITHPTSKNKIDTINETDKPQVSKSKKDKSISNKSNKGRLSDKSRWLDKSSSSQRTETEDTMKTVNKSRSISSAHFFDKSTNKEQPKEIYVRKDNPSISGMYGHWASVTSGSPDKQRIQET